MRCVALALLALCLGGCAFIDDFSKFEFRESGADAGPPPRDTGPDARAADAGSPDGGPPADSGPPDTGPRDAGPPCDPPCGPCEACVMEACLPLGEGVACTDTGGATGQCRGDRICCSGCWTGSVCETGDTAGACGTGGAACEVCGCDGDACTGSRCMPRTPVETLAAGDTHTCARSPDGTIRCWGGDGFGQLADGMSGGERAVPGRVADPAMVTMPTWLAVATGGDFTCTILAGGELYCAGANGSGQLGMGDRGALATLTRVGTGRWRAVEGGGIFTCGIDMADAVHCWGANASGQTGTGMATFADLLSPTPAIRIGASRVISAGGAHACAIDTGDQLWCWGDDNLGATGIMMAAAWGVRPDPTRVGADSWRTLGTGHQHTCAIRNDGALFCWGNNANGRLGLGMGMAAMTYRVPQRVGTETSWDVVSGGLNFTCAIAAGEARCWGAAADGRLGFTSGVDVAVPTPIARTDVWRHIAAGRDHACAVNAEGLVYCWGLNNFRQAGRPTGASFDSPQRVCLP